MQALYAFQQSPNEDLVNAETQLFSSIDKIYDLYLYLLLLPAELADCARVAGFVAKHFPTKEHLVVTRFSENLFIKQLMQNSFFLKEIKKRVISWKGNEELVQKLFVEIKNTPLFKKYILSEEHTFASDKAFVLEMFSKHIVPSTDLQSFIEEKNIFWNNSEHWMAGVALKSLEKLNGGADKNFLVPVFKDESDKTFVRELFMHTIIFGKEYEQSISEKTKNWEMERIALMDVILMKMALVELVHFKFIPVKVSINEYLDIARDYSTPKSNAFINGIIDKLSAEFKANGKIQKIGAGLVE